MPDFELVPLDEAERNTQLLGKRGAPKRQYIGYIERLEDGHAETRCIFGRKAVPVLLNADLDAAKRRVLNTGCQ